MALIFSPRTDRLVRLLGLGVGLGMPLAVGAWYYYALPGFTRVGYRPDQPVPFSHALHVGQLGMDCRFCHSHVAESPQAGVPSTQTCMNCHALIKTDSPLLSQVRESWNSRTTGTGNSGDRAVEWKRIHKLPEYAYFNHAVHVNRGVGCVSCHGPINEMKVVYHAQPLSMGWCLNCHREPENYLRPNEQVFNPSWQPDNPKSRREVGAEIKEAYHILPPQTCQGCHR